MNFTLNNQPSATDSSDENPWVLAQRYNPNYMALRSVFGCTAECPCSKLGCPACMISYDNKFRDHLFAFHDLFPKFLYSQVEVCFSKPFAWSEVNIKAINQARKWIVNHVAKGRSNWWLGQIALERRRDTSLIDQSLYLKARLFCIRLDREVQRELRRLCDFSYTSYDHLGFADGHKATVDIRKNDFSLGNLFYLPWLTMEVDGEDSLEHSEALVAALDHIGKISNADTLINVGFPVDKLK